MRMSERANYTKDTVSFDGKLVKETNSAALFLIDGTEYWVPKSVCYYDEDQNNPLAVIEIEIQEWFVNKECIV